MEIDVANITRNDVRIVVHGAVQMMYADGEVYHNLHTSFAQQPSTILRSFLVILATSISIFGLFSYFYGNN